MPLRRAVAVAYPPGCLIFAALLWSAAAAINAAQPGPQPGDVYREFAFHASGNLGWRVTDPEAMAAGAQQFLPNPVHHLTIEDLQHAERVELLVDRWGGHLGTTNKRIRWNGNQWLVLPELQTTPAGAQPELYYSQDNPIISVPLHHLQEGTNTLEATCDALPGHNWGQWGLYSAIVRIYYDPSAKEHPAGTITTPGDGALLTENQLITVAPTSSQGVARVDLLAWYDGLDEDGDGVFAEWHHAYFQPYRGAAAEIREHVGTLWRSPYELRWNTEWVPDLSPGSLQLIARVQDSRGLWFVTQPVTGLSLDRDQHSVRLFRSQDVPERFGVRVGQEKACSILLPSATQLERAQAARLALRTWHGWDGHHKPLELNGWTTPIQGKNHHYDYDLIPVPVDSLRAGANVFTIRSNTEHHMLEVLWPGPMLLVRFAEQKAEVGK